MRSGPGIRLAAVGGLAWVVSAAAQPPARDVGASLVDAAMERLSHEVTYDGSYRRIDYPGWDVPDGI